MRHHRSGVDAFIDVMNRRADVLRLTIDERPEVGAGAAVIRRQAQVDVGEPPLECSNQRRFENARAEYEADVGPKRGHPRDLAGLVAAVAADSPEDGASIERWRRVRPEITRLRGIACGKVLADDAE